ncbi:kinesin-like protein KIF6 isoform X1 [Syngnathus typhle]|uniref:kinesin-like protein KIF6 isoform X1 n=1 Tax=Syngnathus typhle TaxID=161592 RepID=UPI002A6B4865|nr:kinesin-like protein KIF6 isoform X1 [Syngnathus typhle]
MIFRIRVDSSPTSPAQPNSCRFASSGFREHVSCPANQPASGSSADIQGSGETEDTASHAYAEIGDGRVYSVNNEQSTSGALEFVVPKDMADGFVNNKRECFNFRFQKVFDQASKQEEIFEHIAKPVADRCSRLDFSVEYLVCVANSKSHLTYFCCSVLSGYNGTIFAYGQTGSGKTFTITGGAERYSDRGIIPRTLSYLYECFTQDSSTMYSTHVSYLEIYNEMGYDLLDSRHEASRLEDLPKVMIMEDTEQNIHLRNLSLQQSANEEEALNLLFLGDTNRMIAETPTNQASTRSHCIFTVHLCRREPGSATLRRSKLHLVDLAGSDRVSKTGLNGQLLTEAKYINLSLHYLEQVIIALSERNRCHIPYRNSMLTSVLRDSLGGNCKTTMIATLAVDQRNLYESISTCRFAQRVAIIKNEAMLNEELDPALLIARLKQEVECLKEELTMLTGEERDDQLTVEEMNKLEESVKAFLDDPDPGVTMTLGPDMRKIHHCFRLLKTMILGNRSGKCCNHDIQETAAAAATPEEKDIHQHQTTEDVNKLKELLQQRDHEISVLVKILKKDKKRANDATMQLARICDVQNTAKSDAKPGNGDPASTGPVQYTTRGPQLSIGKQEAFESFLADREDHHVIEDNKSLLKQRSAEAKKLGEQLHEAKEKINEFKKGLEVRRRQRAAYGVIGNHKDVGAEVDPVEENLREHIEQEKKIYKSTACRLKALRTEMEHLQLLLERAKVKLHKDFQKWWNEEASNVQESKDEARGHTKILHGASPSSSPGTPDFETLIPKPACSNTLQEEPAADFSSSPEWKALSKSSLAPSSIPRTGDKQTDADILAFIRARQNLLNRALFRTDLKSFGRKPHETSNCHKGIKGRITTLILPVSRPAHLMSSGRIEIKALVIHLIGANVVLRYERGDNKRKPADLSTS